jgi:hypothetical protein
MPAPSTASAHRFGWYLLGGQLALICAILEEK